MQAGNKGVVGIPEAWVKLVDAPADAFAQGEVGNKAQYHRLTEIGGVGDGSPGRPGQKGMKDQQHSQKIHQKESEVQLRLAQGPGQKRIHSGE